MIFCIPLKSYIFRGEGGQQLGQPPEINTDQLGTKEGKPTVIQINQVCRISVKSLRTAATFVAGGSPQGFVVIVGRIVKPICNSKRRNELLCI